MHCEQPRRVSLSVAKTIEVLERCARSIAERSPKQQPLSSEEQKRSEAFFCGCITAYSLFFAVNTAGQMLVQYSSLLSSTWQFAGYSDQTYA